MLLKVIQEMMNMEHEEEYKQNRTAMKKIKKEDTMILIIFAACLVMAVWMLVAFL